MVGSLVGSSHAPHGAFQAVRATKPHRMANTAVVPANTVLSKGLCEARLPRVLRTRKPATIHEAGMRRPAMLAGQPMSPARASTTNANPTRRNAAIALNARSRGGRTPECLPPRTTIRERGGGTHQPRRETLDRADGRARKRPWMDREAGRDRSALVQQPAQRRARSNPSVPRRQPDSRRCRQPSDRGRR